LRNGITSLIAVIVVSVDAIRLSTPMAKVINQNKIDQRGDTFKLVTAYGNTTKARPLSRMKLNRIFITNSFQK